MAAQGRAQYGQFGQALSAALDAADRKQAYLAAELRIDAGQVSRWKSGQSLPLESHVTKMDEILGSKLHAVFHATRPAYELYVSAPILGLTRDKIPDHH